MKQVRDAFWKLFQTNEMRHRDLRNFKRSAKIYGPFYLFAFLNFKRDIFCSQVHFTYGYDDSTSLLHDYLIELKYRDH